MRYSELSNRVSGKGSSVWDDHYLAVARRAAGEDVIVMSVGDPDFNTPDAITQEAIRSLQHGDTHYTETVGRSRLRKAIASKIGRINGVPFTESNVVVTAGTQNALYASAALLLDPDDEVLVLEPMFTTYHATIRSTGAEVVTVPCPADSAYQPDIEVLRKSITDKTKAIFLASPANPTGAMISPANLELMAKIAIEHDLWVVSDEIYCDFIFDGEHHSISAVDNMKDRTIVVGSLSKSHAMTGWRVGWAIGPEAFVNAFSNLNLAITYGLPGFVQEAGALALEQELAEVHDMKMEFKQRRDKAVELLGECSKLQLTSPAAGMFLMVNIEATGLSGLEFSKSLYQEKGVSVLDGAEFGPSGEGFIRISFATSTESIAEGCKRILSFANSINNE